ncbi:hypothetical protein ACFU8W_48010 [Streptomyces sp. NPDC057565]|uniref:hypothetical protein n=1 Tax=Streptomyces sp. NPDC057565 TaxID=3346169 RepID=UPI0036A5CAB7
MSLVELVDEHAHHDEVVVPAGEENVFPQIASGVRADLCRLGVSLLPRTPVLYQRR